MESMIVTWLKEKGLNDCDGWRRRGSMIVMGGGEWNQ